MILTTLSASSSPHISAVKKTNVQDTKTMKTKMQHVTGGEAQAKETAATRQAKRAKMTQSRKKRGSEKRATEPQMKIRLSTEARCLLDNVPLDISRFVGNHDLLRAALDYSGEPLAKSEGKSYVLTIVPDKGAGYGRGIIIVECKAKPGYPVAAGSWMDFWEPYMKTYHGVARRDYYKLPIQRRAQIEANEQMSHWLEGKKLDVFPEQFARTYHPDEFDKWMLAPLFWREKSVEHWRERFLSKLPLKSRVGKLNVSEG